MSGNGRSTTAPLGPVPGLLLVVGLAVGACSSDSVIDHAKVQDAIVDHAAANDLTLADVECPEGVEAVAGDSFTCSATLDTGEVITVVVTQTDGDGTITLEQVEAVIDGVAFAGAESERVSADYATTVTVSCPSRIVVDDGGSFACLGTDERGHRRTVTFTAIDADAGDFTYVVEGLPPPSTTTTT